MRFLETADAQEANRGRLPQACPPRRWLRNGELAGYLGVSKMTVVRLIKDGILPAKQTCKGAPYVIREMDLDLPTVGRAIENGRAVSHDPRQGTFEYQ